MTMYNQSCNNLKFGFLQIKFLHDIFLNLKISELKWKWLNKTPLLQLIAVLGSIEAQSSKTTINLLKYLKWLVSKKNYKNWYIERTYLL